MIRDDFEVLRGILGGGLRGRSGYAALLAHADLAS
jgi:hypothetical protein